MRKMRAVLLAAVSSSMMLVDHADVAHDARVALKTSFDHIQTPRKTNTPRHQLNSSFMKFFGAELWRATSGTWEKQGRSLPRPA